MGFEPGRMNKEPKTFPLIYRAQWNRRVTLEVIQKTSSCLTFFCFGYVEPSSALYLLYLVYLFFQICVPFAYLYMHRLTLRIQSLLHKQTFLELVTPPEAPIWRNMSYSNLRHYQGVTLWKLLVYDVNHLSITCAYITILCMCVPPYNVTSCTVYEWDLFDFRGW